MGKESKHLATGRTFSTSSDVKQATKIIRGRSLFCFWRAAAEHFNQRKRCASSIALWFGRIIHVLHRTFSDSLFFSNSHFLGNRAFTSLKFIIPPLAQYTQQGCYLKIERAPHLSRERERERERKCHRHRTTVLILLHLRESRFSRQLHYSTHFLRANNRCPQNSSIPRCEAKRRPFTKPVLVGTA